ncbi:hypothetical protein BDZ94DRAFT_1259116, partial [Collybia nuda]
MSGAPMESYNIDSIPPRPEHHLHNTNELLPGTKGAASTIDYSADTMNHTPNSALGGQSVTFGNHQPDSAASHPTSQTAVGSSKSSTGHTDSGRGNTAYNTERPLGVKPTSAGGVAIGGEANLPEGKAGATDKLMGKIQKVAGKYTHNMELHEKGELREAGGKAAATGQARAPH